MEKLEKFLTKYPLLIIFLLSLPAMAALLVPGFYGASDDLHIAWLHEMDKIIREGQFPPRFVPDLSYGFGYPLFNFVFPLPFYIAEAFHLIGISLVDSIKLLFGLSLPLSGYFMYKLLKQYAGTFLAVAGAIVYIYTPYRSTDIYVRGAIGEIVAFVFLPLIILSVIKICADKRVGKYWMGVFALSTAALILSHNIMAYMFFPFVLGLAAIKLFFTATPRLIVLLKILFGLILGLAASSYFWLPAIVESSLLKYDTVFNFKDHFPTLRQLSTPYFGYGASVPGPYDGMSFFIGTINLVLFAAGVILFFFNFKKITKEQLIISIWALVVFLVSIFLMNYRASLIWDNLPLIPYFQFPWRFLSMTTFATPIFVILLQKLKYSSYLGFAIIAGAIILNISYFKPHDFLGRTDQYYLDRYIPYPKVSDEYRNISEEYLRLPLSTQVRPDKNYPRIEIAEGELSSINYINSLNAKFNAVTQTKTTITYYKYLFPGWTATVDGSGVPLRSGEPFGQIIFDVDAGTHKVEVRFKESNTRMVFNLISLLSLTAALGLLTIGRKGYETE